MNAIELRGVTKRFGSFVAVDHLDLDVPAGVCFGLLGPNGAGKTTAIRMVQCVSAPDEGEIRILGMDPKSQMRRIKQVVGAVGQEDNLDPDFTVLQNLTMYGSFFGLRNLKDTSVQLLRDFNLEEKRDGRVGELSGGMRRRLTVARSLIHSPKILILDEPTTGLDPQARQDLWAHIRRLRKRGTTVLLTTHYMDEAENLCDELVIVDQGKILERGTPRALIAKHTEGAILEVNLEEDVAQKIRDALADEPIQDLDERLLCMRPSTAKAKLDAIGMSNRAFERRATLEDVFLSLTGRTLRDA